MKIGILSFRSLDSRASVEELLLRKAAKERGHSVKILRDGRFQMVYSQEDPWVLYDGKPLPKYDVIITRPSVLTDFAPRITLIKQMEMIGLLLFNRHDAIARCKNKVDTMQTLVHYGIPMPKTVAIRRPEDLVQAAKICGGFPLIVKQQVGSFGNGVTIVESMRALKSSLLWNRPMYILQQYVKYSRGKDIRIFVVNGKVIGSMMRSAKKGEFRSNLEQGGEGTPVEITEEESSIAIRSVQALDLNYGGVDVMRGEKGPVVLEVNSNPGFKGLTEATGVDVAGCLVDYALEYAQKHMFQ